MYAFIALALIPLSLGYAAFVDRLTPYRMLMHMLLGFGVMLGISWLGMFGGMGTSAIAIYFVTYGVISELLLAHFNGFGAARPGRHVSVAGSHLIEPHPQGPKQAAYCDTMLRHSRYSACLRPIKFNGLP